MTPPQAARETFEPITAVIADRVRVLRGQAGMSQADLAAQMDEQCGIPWKRATVVNLEKSGTHSRGETVGRDALTVQELLGLSYVLDVPVVTLLTDLNTPNSVVGVGDVAIDPWFALGWFLGQVHLGGEDRPVTDRWRQSREMIQVTLQVWQAIRAVRRRDNFEVVSDAKFQQEVLRSEEDRHRSALHSLRRALDKAAKYGASFPPIPDDVLARADELGIEMRT